MKQSQELMGMIYDCVSYLNTETQKKSALLNNRSLSDVLDYLITECHYQYSVAELPENKYARGYKINEISQQVKYKIWDYIIIK